MLGDAPLGGLAEVVPEMPPVCDLDGLRCTGGGALGEERRPVPAHDLDAGPMGEPGRQARCLPVGQQVDRAAGLDVDENGAVVAALRVAYSSTRTTRGAGTSGSGRASTRRRTVLRLTQTPSAELRRAPARPARARPTAASVARSRSVRWPCRRVRPGICSTKVRRVHSEFRQANRRTLS